MVSGGRSDAARSVAGQTVDLAIDAREVARRRRRAARSCASPVMCARALSKRSEQFRGHDDVLRLDDVDAMGERRPGQIGVERARRRRRRG